jgi:hypothetical protein
MRQLVLESEGTTIEESSRKAGGEDGERGMPVNGYHTCLTAYIAEGFVMWTGDYVASIAAH